MPIICFATDLISEAYDVSSLTFATLSTASIPISATHSVPAVPVPFVMFASFSISADADGIQNTETFVELERTEKSPMYLSS